MGRGARHEREVGVEPRPADAVVAAVRNRRAGLPPQWARSPAQLAEDELAKALSSIHDVEFMVPGEDYTSVMSGAAIQATAAAIARIGLIIGSCDQDVGAKVTDGLSSLTYAVEHEDAMEADRHLAAGQETLRAALGLLRRRMRA